MNRLEFLGIGTWDVIPVPASPALSPAREVPVAAPEGTLLRLDSIDLVVSAALWVTLQRWQLAITTKLLERDQGSLRFMGPWTHPLPGPEFTGSDPKTLAVTFPEPFLLSAAAFRVEVGDPHFGGSNLAAVVSADLGFVVHGVLDPSGVATPFQSPL